MKTPEPSIPFDPVDYTSISVEALPSSEANAPNALHLCCNRRNGGNAIRTRWVGEGKRRVVTGAGVIEEHFVFLEGEEPGPRESEKFLEWLTGTPKQVLWDSCKKDTAHSRAIVEAICRRITAKPYVSPQPIPRYLITAFGSRDAFDAEVARIEASL